MRAALCDTALRGTQTGRGYKALQEHTVENRSPHRFEAVAPGVLRAQMGNTRELHSAHSDVGTTGGQGAEQHWDTQHLRTDRTPKVRSPQAMRILPPLPFPLSHPSALQETPRAQCSAAHGEHKGLKELGAPNPPRGALSPQCSALLPQRRTRHSLFIKVNICNGRSWCSVRPERVVKEHGVVFEGSAQLRSLA